MAGRPAAVRGGGGGGGLLYGVIAFAVISVLSLGFAIFMLTNVKRIQAEADRANARLREFGTPPGYFAEEAKARNAPVFGVMAGDLEEVVRLFTGRKDLSRTGIESRTRSLLETAAKTHPDAVAAGGSVLDAVTGLDRALGEAKRRNSELTAQVAALQSERETLRNDVTVAATEFKKSADSLATDLRRAEEEKVAALNDKDRQLDTIRAASEAQIRDLNEVRTAAASANRENEVTIGRLQGALADAREAVQELKPDLFDPTAILKSADGRVLRAIPGSDVLYLSIGARDGLKPGTGFEIYSDTPDARKGVRGKASVEVVTVMNDSSECIVKRTTPGQPIVENDVAVNLAFERGRKPKFVVRGSFDLNYDGVIDDRSVERVEGMIREWGGQVVDELDETTDYLVVGVAPFVPRVAPGQSLTPIAQVQFERQKAARESFGKMIEQASALGVPVVTQSQLLFLMGYPGDTTIRLR